MATGFEVPGEKYTVITTPLVTNSGVKDVFIAEDRYAIMTTGSGIDIVDLYSGVVIASGTIAGAETTCVTVDDSSALGSMYVGTSGSGVYSATWKPLRAPGTNFSDKLTQHFSTATVPAISDDIINDMCARPFRLLISTGSGINFVVNQIDQEIVSSRSLISGSAGCYLTSSHEGYWIATNSGIEVNYDLDTTSGTGVIGIDFLYDASTTPALPSNTVSDLSVVPGTNNLLGAATPGGDRIIEEQQGAESTALAKSEFTQPIVSIDFSKEASFNSGSVYIGASGSAMVYDLSTDTVVSTHYHTIVRDEKFDKENTRDQALVTGTVTILRTTGVA